MADMPSASRDDKTGLPLLYGNTANKRLRAWGRLIKTYNGPVAMAAGCPFCKYRIHEPKPPRGHAGRGWGLATSGKLRGAIIRHIKAEHPEKVPDE